MRFLLLLLLLPFSFWSSAYNMRRLSNEDGLSNSAILSLRLDDNGYLWIGTCDGVNIADGTSVNPFQSMFPGRSLSGNIIEEILNGGDGRMWVLTNYGLDLFDSNTWEVTTFPQFHGQELLCADPSGRLYVLSEDSRLFMYDPGKGSDFLSLGKIPGNFNDVKCVAVNNGMLWVVTSEGIFLYDDNNPADDGKGKLHPSRELRHIRSKFAKYQDDSLFIISPDGLLCRVDNNGAISEIADLSDVLSSKGRISDLIRDHQGNFFVSFSTDGILRLSRNRDGEYVSGDPGLQVGVFCLEQSADQDVVWIGSDCQGIYMFWDDAYSLRSFDFNALGDKISHPVRAVFIDGERNMWLGTKGDGLLKIPGVNEFSPHGHLDGGYLFTSSNSELCHNSVFGFGKSRRPILWIATEDGLNYYNYADNKLYKVEIDPSVKFIHGVYEESDSLLWMCTLGQGVVRAKISGSDAKPELSDVRFYKLDDGKRSSNQFFSITVADDGGLFFCNRGSGVYEIRDGKLAPIPIRSDFGTNVVKDVFTAVKAGDVMWLGTGAGLIKLWPGGESHFVGVEDGFANNTIHDMIRDEHGDIWMSTNDGIVRFVPETGKGITFGRSYGLTVTEYSDGAGFYSGKTLVFGGINGITFINLQSSYQRPADYRPELSFLKLSISGESVPLVDYLDSSGETGKLVLGPDQNYFSITVSAPDFIDSHNYIYSYTLDGINWINNGPDTSISFNGMGYGTYNLSIRYVNRASGISGEPFTLKIVIKAPWYLSAFARTVYLFAAIAIIFFAIRFYLRRQKRRQDAKLVDLEQQHKEEVYEEKLRFFTNITHEFCTPLTLIYGPCERILEYSGTDDYIRQYVELVRQNVERLNTLIQELIDFRRIETGHKRLKITRVGVSSLCSEIMTSFSELADRNNISLINEISPGIEWTTDFSCLRKIVTNLISNAFKYTPVGGTIRICVRNDDSELLLSVFNTGNGISDEDKQKIFNRYSVLDNVEENAVKGLSSRNGLGLAICHSMVDMLSGSITIESVVGEFADFIVRLPALETQVSSGISEDPRNGGESRAEGSEKVSEPVSSPEKETKVRILVVDDNREILDILADSLAEYDVITAESADKALDVVRRNPPDLIISDIMMPGTDGVAFTRMIKQNKHTMHIPLILLSAKTSNAEKVEGIESGADAYIGKPFSLAYVKAVVKRLLENRGNLREYFTTAAGAFQYSDGQVIHREDKDFLNSVVEDIESNIGDSDFDPEALASHLNISVRNLYRRFKELDQMSPNDFIKYHRISYAAKLLVTTSATVQEVMYKSGFTNRSHFYKEFDKRFGMTPKNYRDANTHKDTSLL